MYHQADNQGFNEIGARQTYDLERSQPIWGEVAKSAKSSYQLPDLFISDHVSAVAAPTQNARVDNTDFLLAQELISDLVVPRRYRS